jgi:hypothetical protein
LLLLLNLLRALRFDAWLHAQPTAAQQPFVQALLAHALDRCGAPAHDPQRAWLQLSEAELASLCEARWEAGRLSLLQALRLWHLRMRRALRRHVGLDLAGVVQRMGWLSATATHLDVVYALDEVAMPLRRQGLDCDPGWLPWFGRIVVFHFVSREWLPVLDDEAGHG